ncbi:MAG: tetratricopeptide repeat protein [Bacteroidota bacterium]
MKFFAGLLFLMVLGQAAFGQDHAAKGKAALTSGDTALAVSSFEDAVRANQDADEAHYFLGAIALKQGRVEDAVKHLGISVELEDENVAALKSLGDAYMEKDDVQNALKWYGRAVELDEKNPEILTAHGFALLKSGAVDRAIQQFVLAKDYNPSDPRTYVGLGDAYLEQKVVVLAAQNYSKAIELKPNDLETRFQLARVYEQNRQYTEAVREYDGAIAVDSTFAGAYFSKGKILVRAKRYARAVPPLKKYVMLEPEVLEGQELLTKAYFGAESFTDAAAAAERTLEMDSSNVDVWRIYAQSQVETRNYGEALVGFASLQRLDAFASEDQAGYGTALYRLGREDEALRSLLMAVEIDSAACDPYFTLGSIYMKKGMYDSAAAMFERRIECDSRSLSSYLNGAASYMQVKEYGRAKILLVKALELKPDWLLGRLWLGRYYSYVDSLDEARALYDSVLVQIGSDTQKYRKEAGEAHYMIASYYFQKELYGQCATSCRSAYDLQYDNAGLQLMWGQSMLQLLNPKEPREQNRAKVSTAVDHFQNAVRMNPADPAAHLWLAQGYVLMREEGEDEKNRELKGKACEEYRKVLKIDPRNKDAKKGMELIGCPG